MVTEVFMTAIQSGNTLTAMKLWSVSWHDEALFQE